MNFRRDKNLIFFLCKVSVAANQESNEPQMGAYACNEVNLNEFEFCINLHSQKVDQTQ